MPVTHSTPENLLRCAVCSNSDQAEFPIKYTFPEFSVVTCSKCYFQFIPLVYRKNIDYSQYKDSNVAEAVRSGNNWIKVERHKLRIKLIQKFINKGKLFDIGAGWGHFLLAARESGFDVSGVEMSEQQFRYCKRDLNLNVSHVDFFQMDETEKFDVVTMWDVLEHIDHPDICIEKCSRITSPGGYLVILVPQVDSLIARLSGKDWKMLGLDHVNYFSKKTLARLLNRYGYEVKMTKTSFELKLFIMYTLLPWIRRLRRAKHQSMRDANSQISAAERQLYFNKFTQRPKWQLSLMMIIHNIVSGILSALKIGDEMVVLAQKKKRNQREKNNV